MRSRKRFCLLWAAMLAVAFPFNLSSGEHHPCIYTDDVQAVRKKINTQPWAAAAFQRIKEEVDPCVNRHLSDPQWIVSRLAMYWKDGEHFTQCYMKDQHWDWGEGNAPVPTVRMPGMRTWNKYVNVPLEDRIPYNESGDMLGLDKFDSSAPPVLVPYKESGHMVRSNNVEILTLAEKAAFVHWVTGEEKYAVFAADIYEAWVLGTYYMNPILDPGKSSGSGGGWEPGGICGFYDYEQIHDDLAKHAAVVYDFLFDYLNNTVDCSVTGMSVKAVSESVFKKFIELGLVRGGRNGNWNVNGWDMLLRPILVLDDDTDYPDGRGRQYYLHYLLEESTRYRACIPDIIAGYNAVTGLWPESPGYGFGTIDMLTDWAMSLRLSGVDIIQDNPILQKAAMAVFPWMDARCNIVAFGDSRSGSANFTLFEKLYSYYESVGDSDGMALAAGALNAGIHEGKYSRSMSDWIGLCCYSAQVDSDVKSSDKGSSYSKDHRFITMKSPGTSFPMMFTLYGGTRGGHMSPNGLAACFYGYGYNLTPDSSAYESYWSADYVYHQSATGSNTILPGYLAGDIRVTAMDPGIEEGDFLGMSSMSPAIQFASVSAGEKDRTIVLVRTSEESGYYVDLYQADLDTCDYLMHHVGESMCLFDEKGNEVRGQTSATFQYGFLEGYKYFNQVRGSDSPSIRYAEWKMPDGITSRLWMDGQVGRHFYAASAPSSFVDPSLTPGGTSTDGKPTLTLIVRQEGVNAREVPFLAVYEPFKGSAPAILSVDRVILPEGKGVRVTSCSGRSDDIILPAPQEQASLYVITREGDETTGLYLGKGKSIREGKLSLESEKDEVYACIWKEDGTWRYSSSGPVKVQVGEQFFKMGKGINIELK